MKDGNENAIFIWLFLGNGAVVFGRRLLWCEGMTTSLDAVLLGLLFCWASCRRLLPFVFPPAVFDPFKYSWEKV